MLFFTNEKKNKISSSVSMELCVSGIFFSSESIIVLYLFLTYFFLRRSTSITWGLRWLSETGVLTFWGGIVDIYGVRAPVEFY